MELLFSALVVAATVSLVMGVGSFAVAPTRRRLDRLANRTGAAGPAVRRESLLAPREAGPLTRLLARIGSLAGGREAEASQPLQRRLVYAGFRRPTAPAVYMGLRLVLALGLPLAVLAFPVAWTLDQTTLLALLFATTAAGYVGPSLVLDRLVHRRQRRLELSLPDALDLMVVCVEAGFAVNASLARVAEEFGPSNPVFAHEIALAVHEAQAGKSTTEALRRLSDRTGVADLSALTALLIQTERFGTSVADALRVHADAMRVKRMLRAEERAQRAPLKLIFPSVLIFLGVLLIFLIPGLSAMRGAFPD